MIRCLLLISSQVVIGKVSINKSINGDIEYEIDKPAELINTHGEFIVKDFPMGTSEFNNIVIKDQYIIIGPYTPIEQAIDAYKHYVKNNYIDSEWEI